jgi:hypothetical protein
MTTLVRYDAARVALQAAVPEKQFEQAVINATP